MRIKIIVPLRFYPTRNRKFQKNIKKIKKYDYGLISSQNCGEKTEKEGKLKLSFRFVPIRAVIENSKKVEKKFKKLKKYDYGFITSQNRLEKTEKERK